MVSASGCAIPVLSLVPWYRNDGSVDELHVEVRWDFARFTLNLVAWTFLRTENSAERSRHAIR